MAIKLDTAVVFFSPNKERKFQLGCNSMNDLAERAAELGTLEELIKLVSSGQIGTGHVRVELAPGVMQTTEEACLVARCIHLPGNCCSIAIFTEELTAALSDSSLPLDGAEYIR